MERESFLNRYLTQPKLIETSNLGEGTDFRLQNKTNDSIRNVNDFLNQLETNVVGSYDNNGKLNSDGFIGRILNNKSDKKLIDTTNNRIKEAENNKNQAILSAVSNIDSLALKKRDINIINATGIPDATEAKRQFENAIRNEGFNSIEHFAEVHSAFNKGDLQIGSPRYNQIKDLINKHDSFVNGVLSIYNAEQQYKRVTLNPLTEQDKIDYITDGLNTGMFKDFDSALKNVELKNQYDINKGNYYKLLEGIKAQTYPEYYPSNQRNIPITPINNNNEKLISNPVSSKKSEDLIPVKNIDKSNNNNNINNLNNNQYKFDNINTKDIQLNYQTKNFTYYPTGMGTIGKNIVSDKLLDLIDSKDKFKLSDNLKKLNNLINDYQKNTNNVSEFIDRGHSIEDKNIGKLHNQVNDMLDIIKTTKQNLINTDKQILDISDDNEKKQKLKEFDKIQKPIHKELNNLENRLKQIQDIYNKSKTNNLIQTSNKSNQFEDTLLNKLNDGINLDKMIKISQQKDSNKYKNAKKNGVLMDSEETIALKQIRDNIIDETKQFKEELDKNSLVKKAFEEDNKHIKKEVLYPILFVAKKVLQDTSYKDFVSQSIKNLKYLPSMEEIKNIDKHNEKADKLSNFFDGKGQLKYKGGNGVEYTKFAEVLRNLIIELGKKSKYDISNPEQFLYIQLLSKNKDLELNMK